MGGKSSSTQTSNQTSTLTPWAPATSGLTGLLGQLNGFNINPTPAANTALDQLTNIGNGPNQLANPTMNAALSQLGGGPNIGTAANTLTSGYGQLNGALSPYLSGSALDPSQNAALGQTLSNIRNDVTNSVNPMFAAAGRFGSPANAQALGRGIAQGEAGAYQNAQTNQLNAAGLFNNATGNTASGLTAADVANSGILGQGINNAGTAYGLQTAGPQLALNAALTGQGIPLQNAAGLAGILGGLGGTFGTQTGTGTSTGTQQASGAQQFGTIMGGLGNLGKFLWG